MARAKAEFRVRSFWGDGFVAVALYDSEGEAVDAAENGFPHPSLSTVERREVSPWVVARRIKGPRGG